MDIWTLALQAVLPGRCAGCGRPAVALCPGCTAGLRPAPPSAPPPGVDWWVAPFSYEGALRELVARAKYRGARSGLPWLADEVAAAVASAAGGPVEVVSWPPTTSVRRRQRGFDPAERLARLVAAALGLRAVPLLRRRPGAPQTGRSRAERVGGPLFDPRPGVSAAAGAVLLVDDVATTGGTLGAAARALRAAGVGAVGAATGGRTPVQVDARPLKPPDWRADTRN